jgi:hypothetical protein
VKPAIHVVHGDGPVRSLLQRDLESRFGADYEIRVWEASDDAREALVRDAGTGARVALLFAESPAAGAAELLAAAQGLHPHARRVLLVPRGAWSEEHPAVAALRSGEATRTSSSRGGRASAGCTCP